MDKEKFISLKEVAAQFDMSKATVNYYTNLGLLDVVRKVGNKRLYDKEEVARRINMIREFLNKGYTLRVIKNEFFNA